jgi:phosphoserine phosphatase RsbU/P
MLAMANSNRMKKMRLLVADDDVFFQRLIEGQLSADYDLVIVQDGLEAWHELQKPRAPRLAILDWVMPGLSGPQICRKVRASENLESVYLILLTARNNESDIIAGLKAGADDYITKPPMPAELRARLKMGERVLALQDAVNVQSKRSNKVDSNSFESDQSLKVSLALSGEKNCPTIVAPDYCLTSTLESRVLLAQESGREGRHSKH